MAAFSILDKRFLALGDPVFFARAYLKFKPDTLQAELLRDRSRNIAVLCHRQWGKSTNIAISAAQYALAHPESLQLILSPTERQSREIFRKVHDAIRRFDSKARFPEENKLSLELPNGARIVALPGAADNVRGYSNPDRIIVDEAAFADDELFRAIRPMRANSTTSQLILISTPFGKQGEFYRVVNGDAGGEWKIYRCKAEDNPRISMAFLDEERVSLGPFFAQEYENAFLDNVLSVFDLEAVRSAIDYGIKPVDLLAQALGTEGDNIDPTMEAVPL